MKRGRPKGHSNDHRSFGPLGDIIRKHRLEKKLGLADVAKACDCSVQFISNIEHGRAPLPWEKLPQMAGFLKISLEELQAANLSIRSDFKNLLNVSSRTVRGRKVAAPAVLKEMRGTATALAAAARDTQLQEVIQKYQDASATSKKRFIKEAMKLLNA